MAYKRSEAELLAILEELLALDAAERDARIVAYAGDEAETAERLRALIAADALTRHALITGGAIQHAAGEDRPARIGAYRIVDLIGRGGMGSVYLGERDVGDFDHRVAIKVVRPGPLAQHLGERFRRERQILAGLDHPHIARLFDGGETPDGDPYFVMEYVEGRTLRHVLEDGPKDLDLVDLFHQVCTAVQYAHQKLVVHGDITPANILIEGSGRTAKLIDFGISRISDPKEAASPVTDSRAAYTRAYAAPERAAGAPASIATDVFGLGAVLKDILNRRNGEDMELAAIAAMATRTDPQERYGSVAELLEDLRLRAQGFPVRAVAGGSAYRVRKLLRRHRLLFGSLAAGFVGLVIALVVVTGLYRQAEAARASEAERFAEVRSLARYQLFDLYEAVANLPRSTPVREAMVREAQRYLERLRLVRDPAPDLVIETAEGFRRLGDIQGGPGVANIGDKEGAKASYARGLDMLDALDPDARSTEAWRAGRARLLLSKARSDFFNDFDPAEAVKNARAAERLLSTPEPSAPEEALRVVAAAMVGEFLLYSGENAAASEKMRLAAAAFRAIDVSRLPPVLAEEVRIRQAGNFRNQALALVELRRPAEALQALQGGDVLWAEMREQAPDSRRYMRSHAIHLMQLGALQGELKRPALALAAYEEAERLARQSLALDPADDAARFAVESISAEHAHYLGTLGRRSEALALMEPILARRRALAAADPKDAKRAADVLVMLRPFGDVHKAAGDMAAACRAYRSAKAEFDAFGRRHGMTEELRNTEYAVLNESLRACG